MPASDRNDLLGVIRVFDDAWNRADLDTLMSLITDDCVYSASVGPEPGTTYVGRDAVRRGFLEFLAFDSELEGRGGAIYLADGDRVIAHWSYIDGAREIRGIDVFEFEGGLIKRKDAYRKVFGNTSSSPSDDRT